jgi:hypothetical protein
LEEKIKICHHETPSDPNPETIEIPISEWPLHQSHGDFMGECPALRPNKVIKINQPNGQVTQPNQNSVPQNTAPIKKESQKKVNDTKPKATPPTAPTAPKKPVVNDPKPIQKTGGPKTEKTTPIQEEKTKTGKAAEEKKKELETQPASVPTKRGGGK